MVLSCQQKNRCSLPLWRCFHHSLEHIFKWKQPHQQKHVWDTWSPVIQVPSTSKSNFVVLMLWIPWSLSGIRSVTEIPFAQYSFPLGVVPTQGAYHRERPGNCGSAKPFWSRAHPESWPLTCATQLFPLTHLVSSLSLPQVLIQKVFPNKYPEY